MPRGREALALAARLLNAGYCSYEYLVSGRLSMRGFYDMLRMADWSDSLKRMAAAHRADG